MLSALSRLAPFVLLAALAAGCRQGPRAPALEDKTAYQNDREGFRFVVPEGWVQQAKTDVPPGPVEQERVLVVYRQFQTNPAASFQVSINDLPEDVDLGKELAESDSETTKWKLAGPAGEAKVGTKTGKLFHLRGKNALAEVRRDVIAVRRGKRVYFFTGTCGPNDHRSRDAIRQTFADVVWKD